MTSHTVLFTMYLQMLLQMFGFVLLGLPCFEIGVVEAQLDLALNSEECIRACEDNEQPRTCYYHFTLEYYTTMGRACELCKPNSTDQLLNVPQCQCIEADGFERGMLSINRMLPGPSIQVCQNDKIVVDVLNHVEGMESALHWHGMRQRGCQFYDGVPFLTQCPILSGLTFRYQFVAGNPGTHFYHSHVGLQKIDGQYGSLIVRQPRSVDSHSKLYDQDLPTHVIVLSDWMHEMSIERFPGNLKTKPGQSPENILINGKGRWKDPITNETTLAQLASFDVHPGTKYRFRMINSFGSFCSAHLTIEGHPLTLIAQDGQSVVPVPINAVISSSGERVDFILNANQTLSAYWIHVRFIGQCAPLNCSQVGILRYAGGPEMPRTQQPNNEVGFEQGIIYNPLDGECALPRSRAVCANQLTSISPISEEFLKAKPDHRIILPYDTLSYRNSIQELFKPGFYPRFWVADGEHHLDFVVDGISFAFPRVPPLSQNANFSDTCNQKNLPRNCTTPCHCPHTHHIRKDAIVEVVVYNADAVTEEVSAHPFHLHGHSFQLFKIGRFPDETGITENAMKAVMREHQVMLDSAQYRQLAGKDTVPVPYGGYAILRFKADNPGWWLFHCHILYHASVGMAVILHVVEKEDLPPVPPGFPTCHSYTPAVV